MRMRRNLIILLLSFAFLLNVLYSEKLMNSQGKDKIFTGNNNFAFEFYSKIAKEEKGNIFFSPLSISSAFAMVYEGASGKTAEEICRVFHFQKQNQERWNSWKLVLDEMNSKNKEYELYIANALWIQEGFQILPEYKEVIEKYYNGKVKNLNFVNRTEYSREEINRWVEEKTNKKINNLFHPGSLNQLTRLVLTNAIYFKGEWMKEFDKKETREEDFKVERGKIVKVPMMRITGQNARFNYAELENLQILEMAYKGNNLSMIILLPRKDMESLENSLSERNFKNWLGILKEERVDVFFPKFKLNKKYVLNDNIKEMGAPAAFTPGEADFSKIDGTRRLYIQIAIHQSFVEVNEEGTSAGGATGVGIGITAIPVKKVFRADHPFIFIIQERDSGNILFLGKVYDPTN
jgi:serpin B